MGTLTNRTYPRTMIYVVGNTASDGPFGVLFPFRDADEVGVYVNGERSTGHLITQAAVFGTEGNFVTLEAPVSNARVTIMSETGAERALGELFVQSELSIEIDRIFANLQEIRERGAFVGSDGKSIDALLRRIANLEAPTDGSDAATKAYVDDLFQLAANLEEVRQLAQAVVDAAETVIEWKGAWAGDTDYAPGAVVRKSGSSYICEQAHTSDNFDTDLAAARWSIFAAKGAPGDGTGDMLAENNLSEVEPELARINLQLGSMATKNEADYTLSDAAWLSGVVEAPALVSPAQMKDVVLSHLPEPPELPDTKRVLFTGLNSAAVTKSGTYSKASNILTVNIAGHGLKVGHQILMRITSGLTSDHAMIVTEVVSADQFRGVHLTTTLGNGNCQFNLLPILLAHGVDNVALMGTGRFAANFSDAFPDTDYTVLVGAMRASVATYGGARLIPGEVEPGVMSCPIASFNSGGDGVESVSVSAEFTR